MKNSSISKKQKNKKQGKKSKNIVFFNTYEGCSSSICEEKVSFRSDQN